MDPTHPRGDPKAKLGLDRHIRHGAGGEPRLEDVPKKPKNNPICRGHCATIHNGNNVISVHEWIQPTQERT